MERYIRSFASADEVIELATVRSEMITKDGMTVSHDTHPGWRWSTDVKPLVGTEWCQVHHVGVVLPEASRMLGLAAPGEILASAIVVQLTSDASLSFEDRGEHELRGLSGVRHLYALGS